MVILTVSFIMVHDGFCKCTWNYCSCTNSTQGCRCLVWSTDVPPHNLQRIHSQCTGTSAHSTHPQRSCGARVAQVAQVERIKILGIMFCVVMLWLTVVNVSGNIAALFMTWSSFKSLSMISQINQLVQIKHTKQPTIPAGIT